MSLPIDTNSVPMEGIISDDLDLEHGLANICFLDEGLSSF